MVSFLRSVWSVYFALCCDILIKCLKEFSFIWFPGSTQLPQGLFQISVRRLNIPCSFYFVWCLDSLLHLPGIKTFHLVPHIWFGTIAVPGPGNLPLPSLLFYKPPWNWLLLISMLVMCKQPNNEIFLVFYTLQWWLNLVPCHTSRCLGFELPLFLSQMTLSVL